MTAIRLQSVSVIRRGRKLLDGVSGDFRRGSTTVLIGPNGAGKSTLLKVMAGEIAPDAGAAFVDGHPLPTYPAARLATIRAVVPQSTSLAFPFTALEVVELGGSVPGFGITDRRVRSLARAALDIVGMGASTDKIFTELSGGERQRVHVARALCQLDCGGGARNVAPILLLDEPTASLDLAHQIAVLDEARRRARLGAAVIAVLHDLNLAARYADEVIMLSSGALLARGCATRVFDDALLAEAFKVRTSVNAVPPDGTPFLLPQTMRPAAESSRISGEAQSSRCSMLNSDAAHAMSHER
jgi:iron complex transport system ATP-binding protein